MPGPERKNPRFSVVLPAFLRWRRRGKVLTVSTHTKNISRTGVYLVMKGNHRPSRWIEIDVQLPAMQGRESKAIFRGRGRLLRSEDLGDQLSGAAFAITNFRMLASILHCRKNDLKTGESAS